ncbi:unnamed protein product [Mycena citricolor]|uniref:Dienelactone hydrolase domain-containing protein n=1 Tax=Mycena citricolor TaxID=2018698 RepID=A0AAD2JY81_9AGAR|nr:unnamed protein product [Mycena citricolor]CAK5283758.1 unnamed protein product [Mycena citricolor]
MSCPECITGVVHEGTPTGTETTIGGLSAYTVGESTTQIIVVGVDVFGWKFNNTRLLADEYAAHGFRVVIPDLFNGFEVPQWTLSARDPTNEAPSLVQRFIARPLSLSILIPFVVRNGQASQTARITLVTEQLQKDYPEAKIGFVGK